MIKKSRVLVFLSILILTLFFSILEASTESTASALSIHISEICASCSSNVLQDQQGNSPDWVEILNASDERVSLKGYALAKKTDLSDCFELPDISIEPHETFLVYCGGKTSASGYNYASFKLSASGDQVILAYNETVVDQITFGVQEKDTSLIRMENGEYKVTYSPTPDSANILTGKTEKKENVFGSIVFNEMMASAAPYYNTRGYDWIELKNNATKMINLDGWQIILNGEKTYTLPNTSIMPGDYLKVYMTEDIIEKANNTGYSIPASKGILELYDNHHQLISRISWSERLPGGVSYGLPGDEGITYRFLAENSFGKKNTSEAYDTRTEEVMFSHAGGHQNEEITLELSSEENASIYYTLDGRDPQKYGELYNTPISINETTVVRATAKHPDKLYSQGSAETYIYGIDSGFAIVSVIADYDHLYDPDTGILAVGNGSIRNFYRDWQYPANVEYYDEEGNCLINQLASMAVSGVISRNKLQKSLVFFARSAYGKDMFSFNPFPNRDYTEIKSFVVRNGGSEGVYDGIRFNDALLTNLALRYSKCMTSDSRPVLVLLNGKVWGHMNIRERLNKYTVAALENVPDDDLDNIDILTDDGTVSNGSAKDYKALSQYMKTHDLNDPAALSYVESQMDIDSYFDSVIWQMITGNQDLSNSRWYRVPGGKWTWMIYDLDTSMRSMGTATFNYYFTDVDKAAAVQFDHVPFAALMKVPAMKDQFLLRMAEILEACFTPQFLSSELDHWHDMLLPLMRYHCSRWNDITLEGWEENIRNIRNVYTERPAAVIEYVQLFFKLSDEEVNKYFGHFMLSLNGISE